MDGEARGVKRKATKYTFKDVKLVEPFPGIKPPPMSFGVYCRLIAACTSAFIEYGEKESVPARKELAKVMREQAARIVKMAKTIEP